MVILIVLKIKPRLLDTKYKVSTVCLPSHDFSYSDISGSTKTLVLDNIGSNPDSAIFQLCDLEQVI